jgi:hypothetical protein
MRRRAAALAAVLAVAFTAVPAEAAPNALPWQCGKERAAAKKLKAEGHALTKSRDYIYKRNIAELQRNPQTSQKVRQSMYDADVKAIDRITVNGRAYAFMVTGNAKCFPGELVAEQKEWLRTNR